MLGLALFFAEIAGDSLVIIGSELTGVCSKSDPHRLCCSSFSVALQVSSLPTCITSTLHVFVHEKMQLGFRASSILAQ